MATYEERKAEYAARKDAGSLHSNPFEQMTIPSLEDIYATTSPVAASTGASTWDMIKTLGGPMAENIMNTMKANIASHPIYGGVGQNMGEDIIYDRVDALTGEERDSPNVVNIPGIPEETSANVVSSVSDMLSQTPDLTPVNIQGERVPTGVTGPTESPADLAPAVEQKQAQDKVIMQEAREQAMAEGASEEDVGFMDRMGEQFDLTTLGLAMMAGADNGGSLGANLGKALMLARQAKSAQLAADQEGRAEGRKEGRDEREVAVKEYNAETSRMSELRQRTSGVKPTKKDLALATGYLTNNADFKLADEEGGLPALAEVMAANLAEAKVIQMTLPPEQRLEQTDLLRRAAEYSIQEMNWKRKETWGGLGAPEYGI